VCIHGVFGDDLLCGVGPEISGNSYPVGMMTEHRKTVTAAGVYDIIAAGTSRLEQIVIASYLTLQSISPIVIIISVEVDVQPSGFCHSKNITLYVRIGGSFKPDPFAIEHQGQQRFGNVNSYPYPLHGINGITNGILCAAPHGQQQQYTNNIF